MPFITEDIWHALYDGNPPAKSIALANYPQASESIIDDDAMWKMALVQNLIVEVRGLRKEIGVEEKSFTPIEVFTARSMREVIQANEAMVKKLTKVSEVRFVTFGISSGLAKHSTPSFDVAVIYERTIDIPAERERLTKEIAKYEKGILSAERQLGNEGFLAKAPAKVVEGLKKQEAETRLLLEKARTALDALPKR
jgi:valyl-tRNA synthetase